MGNRSGRQILNSPSRRCDEIRRVGTTVDSREQTPAFLSEQLQTIRPSKRGLMCSFQDIMTFVKGSPENIRSGSHSSHERAATRITDQTDIEEPCPADAAWSVVATSKRQQRADTHPWRLAARPKPRTRPVLEPLKDFHAGPALSCHLSQT